MTTKTADSVFLTLFWVLWVGVFVAFCAGWIANIVRLALMDGFSGLLVLRVLGIFMLPLGAVLGYV